MDHEPARNEPEQQDSMLSRRSRVVLGVALVGLLAAVLGAWGLVLAYRPDRGASDSANYHVMLPSHVRSHTRAGELEVLVGDLWFKPSATRLRAGTYRLVVRSYGVTAHDVMLERAPIRLRAPGEPLDSAAPFGVDRVQPGVTRTATVTLTRGRWALFCSVPGHYQSGQQRYITVYGSLPPGAAKA